MFRSTAFLAVLFVLLWNSGFIGAEYGLPYAGPFTQLFWRYCALALILLLYLILTDRFRWPGWSIVAPTFLVGVLAHAVWLSCSLLSIQYGVPAGIVALVVALQPLVTGALSGAVVGEYTPIHRWIGLVIGFIGVALTISARVDFKDINSLFFYFIPLGAVLAMTTATLIQRKMEVSKRSFILPLDLTLFYHSLASAIVLIIPATLFEGMTTQWQPEFLGAMLWLVFAVSLSAYALMFKLIKIIDATRLASLFYLGPPVTMLMAWAVFDDTLQLMDIAGLVTAGIGVILAQLQLEKSKTTKT
ncbi:MAG: DMT family transporter [Thioalkalispiraceae bacterium]|jgi:drug/metabolite transporter (DMT)-like permease